MWLNELLVGNDFLNIVCVLLVFSIEITINEAKSALVGFIESELSCA
jgi:hypothetical protein